MQNILKKTINIFENLKLFEIFEVSLVFRHGI